MGVGVKRTKSKFKVVSITGDGELSKSGRLKAQEAIDRAIAKGFYIFTADTSELDEEVIRRTNKAKYRRVTAWGIEGSLKWFSNAGKNEVAHYQAEQRDAILVARSDFVILMGDTDRIREMKKFGLNMRKKVGVLK